MVVRWINFASIAIVFGGSVSVLGLPHDPPARLTAIRLGRVAAIIAAVSGFASLGGTIANAAGGPASLLDPDLLRLFFMETPFGPPAMARLILCTALFALALVSSWTQSFILATGAVSAALILSQAWLGHAAEGGASAYGSVMIAAYTVHVLAASAWVGGLPLVLSMIVKAHRQGGSMRSLYDRLALYSAMAIVLVVLVVATGAANTAFHMRGVTAMSLLASPYARILAAKVGLVCIMLVLAACNRMVFMPRLRARGDGGRWLAASVGLEIGIALFALAAAAVLGLTAPPG